MIRALIRACGIGATLVTTVLLVACGVTSSDPPLIRERSVVAAASYARGLHWWHGVQQPEGEQRVSLAPAPGSASDNARPRGRVLRVELRPGDVTDTGGYKASRAEVFGRIASRGTDAKRWPDPVGSTRWYGFSVYLPRGFCTARDTQWLTLTQWKGLDGGSPPVALEIAGRKLELGGKHLRRPLGDLPIGRWTRLVIGMRLSPERDEGWIEVIRDGRTVVRRTPSPTMDAYLKDGKRRVDPTYLKQGLYRSDAWRCRQEAYFGPPTIATSRGAARP